MKTMVISGLGIRLLLTRFRYRTFCRVAANGPLGWQPIPEFIPETNTFITLMLVASQRIFHPEYRSDPIFPAEELKFIGSEFFWTNDDLVATVLACTDHTFICTADGDVCWDFLDDPVEELQDQDEIKTVSICSSWRYRNQASVTPSFSAVAPPSMPPPSS